MIGVAFVVIEVNASSLVGLVGVVTVELEIVDNTVLVAGRSMQSRTPSPVCIAMSQYASNPSHELVHFAVTHEVASSSHSSNGVMLDAA
jgi:hypothetical protein